MKFRLLALVVPFVASLAQATDVHFQVPVNATNLHPDVAEVCVVCALQALRNGSATELGRAEKCQPVANSSYAGTFPIDILNFDRNYVGQLSAPYTYYCWFNLVSRSGARDAPRTKPDQALWSRPDPSKPFKWSDTGTLF